MKDFSFSRIMASWLSFVENKSLHYNRYLSDDGFAQFPDENFVRNASFDVPSHDWFVLTLHLLPHRSHHKSTRHARLCNCSALDCTR
jgi:hypothetical protein